MSTYLVFIQSGNFHDRSTGSGAFGNRSVITLNAELGHEIIRVQDIHANVRAAAERRTGAQVCGRDGEVMMRFVFSVLGRERDTYA